MPLIEVKLLEEVFTPAQKTELIQRLTDAVVAIHGERVRAVTWVLLQDVRSGEWGVGGQGLTTEDVHSMVAG